MKITMYELLGLMLKRQAPKKIEVLGFTMNYVKNAHWGDYEDEKTHIRLSSFRLNECLNDEVEILEEEKKIPKRIDQNSFEWEYIYSKKSDKKIINNLTILRLKYNEIVDYLDYLKSKGDE